MKKILAFTMFVVLAFTIAACGSEDTTNGSKNESENTIDATEVKSQLLNFQQDVVDVLKENHKPFAELKALQAKMNDPEVTEDEKPSTEDIEAKKEEAKVAGEKAVEAIRAIEVPSKLSQYEEDIQSALEDAAKSYEQRIEDLKIESPAETQSKADELFARFEEKLGKVFEDADLFAPDISKELE